MRSLNSIKSISWGYLHGDGSNLIDWNINSLCVLIESVSLGSLGGNHTGGWWLSTWDLSHACLLDQVAIMMLVVVFLHRM